MMAAAPDISLCVNWVLLQEPHSLTLPFLLNNQSTAIKLPLSASSPRTGPDRPFFYRVR